MYNVKFSIVMKRLFLLLLAVAGFSQLFAQDINADLHLGTSLDGSSKYSVGIEASALFGLSDSFKLGAGAGVDYFKSAWRSYDGDKSHANEYSLPVFVMAKFNFSDSDKCSPFAVLKGGCRFNLSTKVEDGNHWTPNAPDIDPVYGNFFVEPQLGLDLGSKYYISAGVVIQGAEWSRRKTENFPDGSVSSTVAPEKFTAAVLALHFGIKF